MDEKVVQARIVRYTPGDKERRIQEFHVPHTPGMTVQVLLRHIYEDLDSGLAFRDYRCGKGICNTCRVKVNGKAIRSCETLVQPGEKVLLEPAGDDVVKDLVVRFDWVLP